MASNTIENLKTAIRQEEIAVKSYRQWAKEADEPHIEEMFNQFAQNEMWHLTALMEKLKKYKDE